MKRICTVCARGGSKGVPHKNRRMIAGRPLVEWTLDQAKQSGQFDVIALSTDDDAIGEIGRQMGVNLVINRPPALASDSAGKVSAIWHCVIEAEQRMNLTFDTVVDLDVTSPLRAVSDISQAIQKLEQSKASNLITGAPARRSPYFNLVELDGSGYARLSKPLEDTVLRRQDAPAAFDMNASIYVWRRQALESEQAVFMDTTLLYEMPEDRSIDIDSETDFAIVELLLTRRGAQ